MKQILIIFISIIIILILISLLGFFSALRPFKIISTLTPKSYDIAYENISFTTKDNLLIRGWFIKNINPHAKTIILLHGYPADKGDILPRTIFLHKTFHLLYFDFRNLGESEGSYSTLGIEEINDLLAAIRYLHTRNINEVGIWGFSLGAAVALMTAPLAPEIKAIVAEGSYARLDWLVDDYYSVPLLKYPLSKLTQWWASLLLNYDIKKISPAAAIEKLQIPILLIHSEGDAVIPFKHALLLQQALNPDNSKRVIFVNEGRHGSNLVQDDIIKNFFDDNFAKLRNDSL